jgi:Tol biopolymer transport system component
MANASSYRVWGAEQGLRILDMADRSIKVLTTEYDNVPFWSPQDDRIMFTRRHHGDFDMFTISADGSDLRRATTRTPCRATMGNR